MGNAARKARKKSGTQFKHPEKEVTPYLNRLGGGAHGDRYQSKAQAAKLRALDAASSNPTKMVKSKNRRGEEMYTTTAEMADYITKSTAPKKNKMTKVVKPTDPDAGNFAIPEPILELDPKPYRVGRKRFDKGMAITAGGFPEEYEFSPRAKYDQDDSHYPA